MSSDTRFRGRAYAKNRILQDTFALVFLLKNLYVVATARAERLSFFDESVPSGIRCGSWTEPEERILFNSFNFFI